MRMFLSEPKLVQEFGKDARLHIEKNFNQELQIKELIKIYERLM